jgi:hypothetical protein
MNKPCPQALPAVLVAPVLIFYPSELRPLSTLFQACILFFIFRCRYPCIDVVVMGRRLDSTIPAHRSHSIAVDLADSNQVAAAASALAGKWYSDSNATSPPPPPGLDIVINNAGVFSGHTSGEISHRRSIARGVHSCLWNRRAHLGHKYPCACLDIARNHRGDW